MYTTNFFHPPNSFLMILFRHFFVAVNCVNILVFLFSEKKQTKRSEWFGALVFSSFSPVLRFNCFEFIMQTIFEDSFTHLSFNYCSAAGCVLLNRALFIFDFCITMTTTIHGTLHARWINTIFVWHWDNPHIEHNIWTRCSAGKSNEYTACRSKVTQHGL